MIEAITHTSIVILVIIVIYQKLTIWGLESEVESKQSMINYMDRTYSKFPKVDFEYKKPVCSNLKEFLDNQAPLPGGFIAGISVHNNIV
jgi:hypothetical protein